MVPGHLLLIAMSVDGPAADAIRQAVDPVPLEGAVDGRVGDPQPVVALEIPDDPHGAEVIRAAQVQDLLDDGRWGGVRAALGLRPLVD